MKQHYIRRVLCAFAIGILSFGSAQLLAQSLGETLNVRQSTTGEGRKSQQKIDSITEDTQGLLTQFKQVMKIVDGLKVYNQQQRRLIANQKKEMAEINNSIDQVTVIERQISPLIERMITNLEKFIDLDMPFLVKERRERIEFLKETLDRPDVAVSEKFSQVMQAYQVENTYGSTIEAYEDIIPIGDQDRTVDVLKWGRVSLVFQSPDGVTSGVWNNETRQWDILDNKYSAGIRDGLRIARKIQTPDLVALPVSAAESK